MNTTPLLSQTSARHLASLASPETQQLMVLGQARGWNFAMLGQAPLPTAPVRVGKWLIVPAEQDTSQIPARALERVQAIYAAGLRPKGFVLVHEAPMALAAGRDEQKPAFPQQFASVLPMLEGLLGGMLVSGFVAIAAALLLTIPLTLVAGALLLDPILIAVTEDGDWIEIDRWWNEPTGGVQ